VGRNGRDCEGKKRWEKGCNGREEGVWEREGSVRLGGKSVRGSVRMEERVNGQWTLPPPPHHMSLITIRKHHILLDNAMFWSSQQLLLGKSV
jgi:hypothetical protein